MHVEGVVGSESAWSRMVEVRSLALVPQYVSLLLTLAHYVASPIYKDLVSDSLEGN